MKDCGASSPKQNAAFVAKRKDVPEIYHNNQAPAVCMDEKPYQLLGEARDPVPVKPGAVAQEDSEYIRNGTCSSIIFREPLVGIRYAAVLGKESG